jgi:hypothetical protein
MNPDTRVCRRCIDAVEFRGRWPEAIGFDGVSIACNTTLLAGDRMQLDQLKRREFITLFGGAQDRPRSSCCPGNYKRYRHCADRKANHARTKCLKQHLGIGRVVVEICCNNSIGIIAAIDPRECAGTRTSV